MNLNKIIMEKHLYLMTAAISVAAFLIVLAFIYPTKEAKIEQKIDSYEIDRLAKISAINARVGGMIAANIRTDGERIYNSQSFFEAEKELQSLIKSK